MIRQHDENTAWWGSPVGVVTDVAWLAKPAELRAVDLAPYAWAELKAPMRSAPPLGQLAGAGFFLADIQIGFRIALADREARSVSGYVCRSAAEEPFEVPVDAFRSFEHERFRELPGVTQERLDRRYHAWSRALVARSPELCLRIRQGDRTEGWFLSEPSPSGLQLWLAMLSTEATGTGHHLYERALIEYARRGHRVGHAAFSATNTNVLNIYARLGARFGPTTGCWLWIAPGDRG